MHFDKAFENSGIIFVIFDHSKISKIDGYFRHFQHLLKIPVHFRKILYKENTVDFRKIFDRQKFSTFSYRELSKVKNFWQTHGLTMDNCTFKGSRALMGD